MFDDDPRWGDPRERDDESREIEVHWIELGRGPASVHQDDDPRDREEDMREQDRESGSRGPLHVEPRVLVQAVKRNADRFPADFMFQLTESEVQNLKSQIVISSWGGVRRARPYALTEQGVAMLSSVQRSKRAIHVNITIMGIRPSPRDTRHAQKPAAKARSA